jgi:glycosyltransferase involved in cell wall biosynthesis
MSRFPRLSETFVLYEMIELERAGATVELFPLIRERASVVHPEAEPYVERMHYARAAGPDVIASNLWWLRRAPRRYLSTVGTIVRHAWRSWNFLLGGLAAFPKTAHYARQMQALGVRHVHCHFANHPALAGLVVRRLTDIPFSFTAHGSDLHVDRTMLDVKVAEAAFVASVSEYNRQMIADECGPDVDVSRVHVLHCGVDTSLFTPTPPAERRGEPFEVLSIGTLHEVKGQQYLLRACAELSEREIDWHCVIVGDGPDREMLEKLAAELGIAHRVDMVGRRTRDEIAQHVAVADVLVAPSVPTRRGKREGIPVVLMEAMSAAVPVVSSRLSGIPELVEHGRSGLLTEPGSVPEIADALTALATDADLRRRLGAQARERVQADFDVATNARRLLGLITSGLDRQDAVC